MDNDNKYKRYEKEIQKDREKQMQMCQKYGESCDFGICDECPVTLGVQTDE